MTDFARFAEMHGLVIRRLDDDGRIHRVPTTDKPSQRNGAYRFTGDWGWLQNWAIHQEPIIWQRDADSPAPVVTIDRKALLAAERIRQADAADRALQIVRRCQYGGHPYLARKGFPDEQGLVDSDGRLVIPMRDFRRYGRINSVQFIDAEGGKKFLPGGVAKGSVLVVGSGTEAWFCEGYATALSIHAALRSLYRKARVYTCFSAGNLIHVAGEIKSGFVFADHDASGTGEQAAIATGLPWVMPPEVGLDANDWHQQHGVRALAELLRSAL